MTDREAIERARMEAFRYAQERADREGIAHRVFLDPNGSTHWVRDILDDEPRGARLLSPIVKPRPQ